MENSCFVNLCVLYEKARYGEVRYGGHPVFVNRQNVQKLLTLPTKSVE